MKSLCLLSLGWLCGCTALQTSALAPRTMTAGGRSVASPKPDLTLQWNAPADYTPDQYEIEQVANLSQFRPNFFTGREIWTTNTNLPIYLTNAPQSFYRVRAWKGSQWSDWGTAVPKLP